MTEVTIDLADLFRYVLKKWKTLLLCALIGAIGLDCYGYKKEKGEEIEKRNRHEQYVEAAKELPDYYTEDLYIIRCSLTQQEAEFVEAYVNVYKAFVNECVSELPDDSQRVQSYMMFLNSYKDIKSIMNSNQWAYYSALKTLDTNNSATGDPVIQEYNEKPVSILKYKWVAIGAVCGIFVSFGLIAIPYLLTKKVRRIEDIEFAYNIPVLSCINNYEDERLQFVINELVLTSKQLGRRQALLIGGKSEESVAIQDRICKALNEYNIEATIFCFASMNLKEADLSTSLVLVIAEEHTDFYQDLKNEIRRANRYHLPIVGCVGIREK